MQHWVDMGKSTKTYISHFCKTDIQQRNQEKHMRQSIQELNKENLWKTAFKKFEIIWSA